MVSIVSLLKRCISSKCPADEVKPAIPTPTIHDVVSLVPRHSREDLRLGTKHYMMGTSIVDVPPHMQYSAGKGVSKH